MQKLPYPKEITGNTVGRSKLAYHKKALDKLADSSVNNRKLYTNDVVKDNDKYFG